MRGVISPRSVRSGALLAALTCLPACLAVAQDLDADGVFDSADNCIEVANAEQRDTDRDGFGNRCDGDFDQDGRVGFGDLISIRRSFGAQAGDALYDADLDLDGDGRIGPIDVQQVQRLVGSQPGPSGLACAGSVPCEVGRIWIEGVEEVLSRAARIVWGAASPEPFFRIERRAPGGSWEVVGIAPGAARAFVDRGPGGGGLPPGRYEYRVRGESTRSLLRSFDLPAECAGQPAPSASLPTVEIVDHEPDGDYDGADVEAALAECSRRRGCVLRGLPVGYDDVNVELAGGRDFANGLVIEGYGSATVFRSRVFSAADHDPGRCEAGALPPCYHPTPVFSLRYPDPARLAGVRFRNFSVEGRKREQPDPGNDQSHWHHWAIATNSAPEAKTRGGCVHNVTARELMSGGVWLRQAEDWIVEHSRAEDIGCSDDLSPCDALERTPEHLQIPGLYSMGKGFYADHGTVGSILRHNRVLRATKYGVAATFGADRFHLHDNRVESSGGTGVQCNVCRSGVIERNVVVGMRYPAGRNASWPDGYAGEMASGLACSGAIGDLAIRDNLLLAGDGSGLRLGCTGTSLVVEGNVVDGNCRKHGQSLSLIDAEGAVLRRNAVRDHEDGCRYSVMVAGGRDVRIEDGTIESGPVTTAGLLGVGSTRETNGLVLRNLRFEGRSSSGIGIWLLPSSAATTLYDSVCAAGFSTELLDASRDGSRRVADAAGACVP